MPKAPLKPKANTPPLSDASPVGPTRPNPQILPLLDVLDETYQYHPMAAITRQDPYRVLTSCILSLRTKDETSMPASERMFALADTPQAMVQVPPEALQQAIYPVGFYRTKAQTIIEASQALIDRFNGAVPTTIPDLLTLKGVGRKTANLVVGLGHGLPAICVDIHVHRICNRLGYVTTTDPEATEWALRDTLPLSHWAVINKVMVLHGQACCRPVSPHCDGCPIAADCPKIEANPRKVKLLKNKL
jgi:endonuclease III